MKFNGTKKAGFTFIELIVASGIILLLTGGAIAGFNQFNDRQKVRQTALTLKSHLRLAQTHALGGKKPTTGCTRFNGWKVNFTSSTYTVQPTCNGIDLTTDSFTVGLPSGITFTTLPFPILFMVLTQGTSVPTIEYLTVGGFGFFYQVSVASNGEISDVGFWLPI